MIITIDGPSGSGKSTIAKIVAKRLGFKYINTGAIYRAVTLKALQKGLDLKEEKAIGELIDNTKIELKDINDEPSVFLDGIDVTREIRKALVTNNIHFISNSIFVRKKLIGHQRETASGGDAVVEGRDIGTVIFPDAEKKIFLDADIRERAKRRYSEARLEDNTIEFDKVLDEMQQRDYKDVTRAVSPLRRIDEAVYIDSTNLSIEEVVNYIINSINH